MKLTINDLSIGDYISYCDRVYKVHNIDGQGPVGASNDSYSSPHILKHVDYLESIPITPEILEQNGFVKNGEYNEWSNGNWDDIPFIGISLSRPSMRIKNLGTDIFLENKVVYVHQLQHALRLAGVEKEINL